MLGYKLLLYCCFFNIIHGANILFFFGVSTYSHRIIVWPLVEEMTAKGHNVTFFSPFEPKYPNPNVTEIHPQVLQDLFSDAFGSDSNLIERRIEGNHRTVFAQLQDLGRIICEIICKNEEILNWIEKTDIDLVIIDGLFNECGLGLAHKFSAPHIIFDTTSVFMWQYDIYGMPVESSWIPDLSMDYPQQMSLYQRISTTLGPLYWYFRRHYLMYPKMETILRSSLNIPDMPPLNELERETSVVLVNTHYSFEYARSLPPLYVPIAGIHCKDKPEAIRNQLIKKDLLKFMNESEDGFVYISFGGAVQISKMKPEFQQIFFSALGNVPTRFVWKWEADRPKEMPENVITETWMPQQEILAHPKAIAFMTHGGLLGMQEAIFNSVPLIVIPVFAEQDYNAERVHRDGYGMKLEVTTLTQNILQDAITQVITNKSYKIRMTEVSLRFRDRITEPLQTAVWWTEFVLRHKNTQSFLRPLSYSQTWYQRRLLDVWLVILIVIVTSIFIVAKTAAIILKFLFAIFRSDNTKIEEVVHSSRVQTKRNKSKKIQ